jgi:hypothetical protein
MSSFNKLVSVDFIIGTGCWKELYERQLDKAISGKTPTVTKSGDNVNITWDVALSAPEIIIQNNITSIHTSIIPWQTALLTNVNSIKESVFSAYNTSGNQTIGTGWVDIIWDTHDRIDESYTNTLGTSSVTINESADYEIHTNITIDNSNAATNASSRSLAETRITLNGVYLNGTKTLTYHRLAAQGGATGSISVVKSLLSGDVLKVQSIKVSGGGNLFTYPDGCRFLIRKLNN